jgi:hypothetical protein
MARSLIAAIRGWRLTPPESVRIIVQIPNRLLQSVTGSSALARNNVHDRLWRKADL